MNFKTALFIDVTNLLFNIAINNADQDMSYLEHDAAEMINQTKCGAIALVFFCQNKETRRIGCLTTTLYHNNIDKTLCDFLTVHFPRVGKRVFNVTIFRNV
jgi:hypothetical protein